MQKYYWSKKGVCFYPFEDKEKYENAGLDLSDVVIVDESVFIEFGLNYPEGKKRGVGDDGLPAWVDQPPPTAEQIDFTNENTKKELILEATAKIAPLQDAVDLDDATDEELVSLKAWKQYRVALNRLDLSTTPEINWPMLPTTQSGS